MMTQEAFSSIVLSRLPGLTQSQALQAIRHYGSAEAALADRGAHDEKWREVLADEAGLRASIERARREQDFCEEHGIRALALSEPDYPSLLALCEDAPAVLFYRGNANLNRTHVVSVVGTRRITDYGRRLCRQLCRELSESLPDALVVSGLAYGVDIHAHRASLECGLDTVGVLAHGLDRIYPAMHRETAADMVRQGGLLTEYLTGTVPDKGNFVRRNRIVAGMSPVTIVVESAAKGGALITARLANSYGRDVMAYPGRVGDEFSAGCNHLIAHREALAITSVDDLLRELNWESRQNVVGSEPQLFPPSEFSPEAQVILDALRCHPDGLHQNRIIELTNLDSHTVASNLAMLLVEGTVSRLQAAGMFALNRA